MQLVINAHSTPCEQIFTLVEHLREEFSQTPLSLCTQPGRPANIAYGSAQRLMPQCRTVSAWSECELLAGACAGWNQPLCCWWPVGSRDTWPTWAMLARLQSGLDQVFDRCGKHCPVGFAGWIENEGAAEPQSCCYEACDIIAGPVAFAQPWAASLIVENGRLTSVRDAGHTICLAAAWRRRACCYVIPNGLSPAVNINERSMRHAILEARKAGWRSRVEVAN